MDPKVLVSIILFGPLVGAIVAGLFGRAIPSKVSQAVTTGLLFLSAALSWVVFGQWTWGGLEPFTLTYAPFIHVGDFVSNWSFRLDGLSAVMLVVVTSVSSLVHLYSWGYMAEDPHKPRFFAYLSLFTFAMLALISAADFMQLFFGWEGVGLASYLLIGFWFKKPTANAASIKAFVVNRVGDFGFALGIMTVFWAFGSIQFAEIFPQMQAAAGRAWSFIGYDWNLVDLACALLFVGAMGKSAQFFLHTWLPDAMEGPTPVSALIHAATMVTAGVYMVCLLSPMFEYAPVAKNIVTVIGAVTALFAATVGLTQNDIKRVIAYSTCSQLGYMFFAAGVGAYQAAMFHLFTHAFFKALLFLGAGSVIHGMAHEQDMRRYGGLVKYLPVTYAVMTIGTIAITGLGIPGVELGFAGFYSKDAIIHAAYEAGGAGHPMGYFAFVIGIFVAGLTAFYSWRLAFFTFNGSARWTSEDLEHHWHNRDHAHDGHDDHATAAQIETHDEPLADDAGHGHGHGHGHGPHLPHESPWSMRLPLILLAIGAVFAGIAFHHQFIGDHKAEFWKGAIYNAPVEAHAAAPAAHAEAAADHAAASEVASTAAGPMPGEDHDTAEAHHAPTWVIWAPLVASVLGLLVAAYMYLLKEGLGARLAARGGPLYTFFYNKWFFDELYDAVFVRGAKFLGDLFWKGGDQKIIDGLGPDGVSALSVQVGKGAGRLQTGYVYHYAFVMLLGVAGLLTYALWAWNA
ncbi:NADH dehydrogenase I, L subunit [Phenylobacterium zucineum HLK1]|uniref:NADH dehydrogenase I, L subunit n=1 Tax=Phenylobacterium zucineum (strain HLK1) TaxID=450851 RepID=B4RCL7_PHEZH|nr:NADH-quinone oxidoreductase subunit L [Phenylobacterium zucineum]ACG78204.1 NADH dehydrogenase I, L subunit [Phenylobacterium zucineum HLK1]